MKTFYVAKYMCFKNAGVVLYQFWRQKHLLMKSKRIMQTKFQTPKSTKAVIFAFISPYPKHLVDQII